MQIRIRLPPELVAAQKARNDLAASLNIKDFWFRGVFRE
jgi:hypothetical protein